MSPITGQPPSPAAQAAMLRGLLESAVLAIITIDLRRLIEERLFDHSAQGLIGRNVKMLMPELEHDASTGR
jgi:hypothetical protein